MGVELGLSYTKRKNSD